MLRLILISLIAGLLFYTGCDKKQQEKEMQQEQSVSDTTSVDTISQEEDWE